MTRRMSSRNLGTVGLVSSLAVLMTGCAIEPEDDSNYSRVCEQRTEQVRYDDAQCNGIADDDDGSSGFVWYYIANGQSAPPVGHKVSGGYRSYKSLPQVNGAAPKVNKTPIAPSGGTISRGGFGVSGGSKGGTGG